MSVNAHEIIHIELYFYWDLSSSCSSSSGIHLFDVYLTVLCSCCLDPVLVCFSCDVSFFFCKMGVDEYVSLVQFSPLL